MNRYAAFALHDPIANIESQITNFDDIESLKEAVNRGMIIIGIKTDNSRHIVSVDEVKEPQISDVRGIPVVLPSYVDSKIDEVMAVIQDLTDVISAKSLIPIPNLTKIQNSIDTLRDKAQKVIADEKETLSKLQQSTDDATM